MADLSTDLFGLPLLPGLTAANAFISAEEERALIDHIDGLSLTPFRFQGWEGKRLTTSFGWSYDFDKGMAAAAPPMPDWLLAIRERAGDFAGLPPEDLVQALLIRYDPGAGIGWHRDRPIFEHVIGISLGEPAVMRFRKRLEKAFGRVSAPLAPRSIYHLSGEARHGWEHSIAEMEKTRWSITLRSLSEKGRRELSLRP
ncbi:MULTISPECIES: alpha-ketoglutarate-dependent dioxygenase AlkB [unclassified Novosphingobium]|uniref:alpha-ketoglutarate-dependent dioxygenase AlkB n=1 Tax=unclassified Novosphingobium TaxID=2644732 RepID=UPI00144230D2|nr:MULTISPECIES: alpha-ketoglutarate-dependent dioxygenase AlkB [unclassified Novosphingobium]MBB3359557.1 alkylated DNA repair dioxygenase AlkB [Novosphingobium sp. BK256]MBB3376077.1 alkylated DNA repair dioxygenase AlkB [Novosphingobium sp. BK280]MBB3380329.1 alkylated DNA repair dioxygenase AlkB [Novosphingobium sp. BK258]MBB3422872.1 alkylated DNA repair dioxygenase AlkB [Novosphingobium sp. BK267]MBB3450842.1 alkylated DNA repair dioxygenase AlkB [Novosphingobium sp. BK352]